jgi:hypothetical protein
MAASTKDGGRRHRGGVSRDRYRCEGGEKRMKDVAMLKSDGTQRRCVRNATPRLLLIDAIVKNVRWRKATLTLPGMERMEPTTSMIGTTAASGIEILKMNRAYI